MISGLLAFAVAAGAVYAAGAMLSPIPPLEVAERSIETGGEAGAALELPAVGASAVVLPTGEPITAGDEGPRPIAGTARLILAHVVLDREPLEVGRTGEALIITADHVSRTRELASAGIRTVPVFVGEPWTRRDLLVATLLGSGNNLAEFLAIDVFGDLGAYQSAARAWLDANGLTDTQVADVSGINPGTTASAADLALLAQLTAQQPVMADIYALRPSTVSTGASFSDNTRFLPEIGANGYVNTYTDEAGVCILTSVQVAGTTVTIALYGQPSYPAAEEALRAVVAALEENLRTTTIVSPGDTVAEYVSDWGQTARIVATDTVETTSLSAGEVDVSFEIDERTTVLRGTTVGRMTVTTGDGRSVVILESAETITEPGIGWRFADPFTVIDRWNR
ncbi:serine-type D-Ala-D-Ala carboxypeptidase [Microcella alkaliphila]|uniref:Serine-type D-Ala-D-Ala carboxypeptidase n=1 Tax=Microcella alkaliphila TaxID=279828 RepID=A0A0U4WYK0_9MICO|nr:serine-type D-Ala-D-Ala carboxypeptidase [Microcella alkaliphila]